MLAMLLSIAVASPELEARLCRGGQFNLVEEFALDATSTAVDDCPQLYTLPVISDREVDPNNYGGSVLVVYALEDGVRVPLETAGFEAIKLQLSDGNTYTFESGSITAMQYAVYATLRDVPEGHNQPVKVIASMTDGNELYMGAYENHNAVELYGQGGFWLPVGLFGTAFERTADGIPFLAAPIGIAWGVKSYPAYLGNSSRPLGFSVGFHWTISNRDSEGFVLAGGTSSFIVDVLDVLYVGGGVSIDFREGGESPQGALLIGLSPRTLSFLSRIGARAQR